MMTMKTTIAVLGMALLGAGGNPARAESCDAGRFILLQEGARIVAEMNADTVAVITKTSTSGAKTTVNILYPQDSTDTNATADALLDRADAIETSLTLRKAIRLCAAGAGGIVSGAPNAPVFKGAGVATTRITGTCDSSGNRSAITLNL